MSPTTVSSGERSPRTTPPSTGQVALVSLTRLVARQAAMAWLAERAAHAALNSKMETADA